VLKEAESFTEGELLQAEQEDAAEREGPRRPE
jgi:hypothetical protein